jgi:hypothetical protein
MVMSSVGNLYRERVNPTLPCVYVGYSAHSPQKRYHQNRTGYWTATFVVEKYGEGLCYELFQYLNPVGTTQDEALDMEAWLAEHLRRQGYAVYGKHGQPVTY